MQEKHYDIVTAGEIIIDLISEQETVDGLRSARQFRSYLGGSPCNLANGLTVLGHSVALIGSLGTDGFGEQARNELASRNITTDYIQSTHYPTSLIPVGRSKASPDFIPYRAADYRIELTSQAKEVVSQTRIFHTTAFALSKDPARSTLLDSAKLANEAGARLSIDFNYAPEIWDERSDAVETFFDYTKNDVLIKLSDDDISRTFPADTTQEKLLEQIHRNSPSAVVCITCGSKGIYLSYDKGHTIQFIEAEQVAEVKDTTGAGDTFWSGFLSKVLNGKSYEEAARYGAWLAGKKVGIVGQISTELLKSWS